MYPRRRRDADPVQHEGAKQVRVWTSFGHYSLMEWLDQERKGRHLTLREIAGRIGYQDSASRVSEYFNAKRVPSPDLVRRLAQAIGVSPIEALWRAGYQQAILQEIAELHKLGWNWCRDDRVSMASSGVLFVAREIGTDSDLRDIPSDLLGRYHQGLIFNTQTSEREIRQVVTLPKPMAVAIFLAVGLFPRRGDVPKATARQTLDRLVGIAGPMLQLARHSRSRGEHVVLPKVLQVAHDLITKAPLVPPFVRAAIVAEYTNAWADIACSHYARYARLALYERGGYMGVVEDNVWAYQDADLPRPNELEIEESNESDLI